MIIDEVFFALKAISGEASIQMRRPRDWYVSLRGVEIGGNGMLAGVGGDGKTPDEAISDAWNKVTAVEPPLFLVINATNELTRRHLRWNGFMWQDVPR